MLLFLVLSLVLAIYLFSKYLVRRPQKIATHKDFNVIVVGAGVSGICIGKKLNDIGVKYVILEKSSSLGGTWYENIYPGCGCDVPSHLYSFSFFLNPNWSRTYSKQSEILKYLKRAADKFGVYPHIEFDQHVESIVWDPDTFTWRVTTKLGRHLTGNIVVSGQGILHVPHTPDLPGTDLFEGKSMHTAKWDSSWTAGGRSVAVIGTGASAVQAVPVLAGQTGEVPVEKLYVFQRTPCWAPERNDKPYPNWMKTMFSCFPILMKIHRAFYFIRGEFHFHTVIAIDRSYSKITSYIISKIAKGHIRNVVKDPVVADKLTPKYEAGCKRVTPSDHYLTSFNMDNVELVTDPITELDKDGIKTEHNSYKVDTLIYATGFDTVASALGFEMTNKLGMSSSEEFGQSPQGYLGICHPNYPNFFWMLGPGTGLGTNSVIYSIECEADFIVDCIRKMSQEGVKASSIKKEVNENFIRWNEETMKGRVFGGRGSCKAWYKNKEGVNWTLWPSDLVTYWSMTRRAVMDDMDKIY